MQPSPGSKPRSKYFATRYAQQAKVRYYFIYFRAQRHTLTLRLHVKFTHPYLWRIYQRKINRTNKWGKPPPAFDLTKISVQRITPWIQGSNLSDFACETPGRLLFGSFASEIDQIRSFHESDFLSLTKWKLRSRQWNCAEDGGYCLGVHSRETLHLP